ncbi:hypothetical protein [Herpetosiphon llansteffanensis]|uniref:hypothetical protein n=1 Tax=Herpetosiphon llansteffanensis TaxID=2094568 RepID=UPI000D7BE858|nr:hypothetical protein [Herpetosiphon llansteffanensis]
MTQPSNGFWFRFFWIPYRAGGHSGPPIFHGRTEVYILNELHQQDKADYGRDIRWEAIRYDPSIQGGVAYAAFADTMPEDYFYPSRRIMIRTGPCVLCIGIVIEPPSE